MSEKQPIIVIDRETGTEFEETVLGEKWIRWAYQDSSSSLIEKLLFRSAALSKAMGWYYDSPLSKGKIQSAIDELNIDTAEFADPQESFASFNEFFIRHLKEGTRPFDIGANTIVSPADGRVLVFPKLDEDTFTPVKGHPFSIRKMLPDIADRFIGGSLAIVRLCPADYHRYHFPCAGEIVNARDFQGAYHSVNPIALGAGPDVFGENKRSYTLLKTENAGTMCYVEVGAFGVGSIVNTKTSGHVAKMDEKGYFKFGGSTVVVLFEPGAVNFSEDLVANSAAGKETLVKVGQPFATVA
ncbi:Phosphatidylserine decarboxylase proenzyme [Pseudovibrio sp. Ad13]|uniref:archaetidylserine decarboxylase n=1 Tax=unclassified Pseudovibrio TaxID=2627060 RepID=UPI0007AE5934|nr:MULTISPECIES: archaetidylserine decarboxylase [unclassified Pseudovibrio]KZK87514.1 Phosphatidylserine decarboxylase proenzyme [Pseudovibrio sp. Ad13]KZK88836.1 Phosphatidylserine decarboxylase proenzyme [Pseudovibrio sp. Ad5]KZL25168.1 Phosphatidylserine decarboxylase proenzyme [Pseudovibrio sp. WM33]